MNKNDMRNSINMTIGEYPYWNGLVKEVHEDHNGFHIWLDGDFDDYEYFMEELGENLPRGCTFRNNLSRGRCHIKVTREIPYESQKTDFKLVFGVEELAGHVEYGKIKIDGKTEFFQDVWYEDQNIAHCFCKEHPPVSTLFTKALANMDLADILYSYYGEDDGQDICTIRNDVLIIINPSDFRDHMVRETRVDFDGHLEDNAPYVQMVSIEQLFCAIAQEKYDLIRILSPMEIQFQTRGIPLLFNVHFGDCEIQEAFLKCVYKMAEIIGGKWDN